MGNPTQSKADRRRAKKNRNRNKPTPASTPENSIRSSDQHVTTIDPVCHAQPVTTIDPVCHAQPVTTIDPVCHAQPVTTIDPVWHAQPVTTIDPVCHAQPLTTIYPAASFTIQVSKVDSPTSKSKSKPAPVVPPGFKPLQKKAIPDLPLPWTLTVVSCVLHGIPQNPHFFPLKNYTDITRNNLMCGWHEVFEVTVNQITSLALKFLWDKAKELWKTLEELQSMGYNVIPLRRRLVEITDLGNKFMMDVWEKMELQMVAETHISEKRLVKGLLLELIRRINLLEIYEDCAKMKVRDKETELLNISTAFERLASDQLIM